MNLKRYIFALVAMLSGFSFSAFAQTKVETAGELQDALETGGKVQLSADIEVAEQIVIPYDKTVTLDLNGYDINGGWNGSSTTKHIYVLSNEGTLTITDTSADKNGSINSRGVYNYGSLTLEAGKIAAIDDNGGYAVNNEPGSSFVMNGGWLAADNEDGDAPEEGCYDATALDVPSGCTATLNAGKITNAGNYTFAIAAAGTLNIPETSTITVEGRHGAIYVSGGTTTVNAGTFSIPENTENTDNVTYVSGGQLIINGGTFIGDSDSPSGGRCVYDETGGATINGGTFGNSSGGDVRGTTGTKINGGTFENLIDTSHVTIGSTIVNGGKTCRKTEEGLVVIVAKIGETEYTSLQEAINAVEAEGVITLISDVNIPENTQIGIPEGKTIELVLNGKTVIGGNYNFQSNQEGYIISNKGTLTITGDANSVMSAAGRANGYGILVNEGTMTINGGTYRGSYWDGTEGVTPKYTYTIYNYGTMTVNNITVDAGFGAIANRGTLTINSGNFLPTGVKGTTCHVVYVGDGTTTINGGTFKMNYPDGGAPDSGEAVAEYSNGAAIINGGTFISHFDNVSPVQLSSGSVISGGTFLKHSGEPSDHPWITSFLKKNYKLGADGKVVLNTDIESGSIELLEIVDGIQEFVIENKVTVGSLTYKRTLASDKFNALYVPFAIPVTQKLLEDYEFFSFDAEQSEEDALVVTRVVDGSLAANTPYLVRPLTEEAKKMTIALQNVILPSTATEQSAKKLTSKDGTEFVITGTYTRISGADYKDFYGVSVNGRFAQIGETGSLGAFRFYMEIKNAESGTESSARSFSIRIGGESDDATGIDQIEVAEPAVNIIIDLQGRRVLQPQKGGLYIMNGKKVVF